MFFNFQLSESSDNVPPSDHLKHQTRTPHRFRSTIKTDHHIRPSDQTTTAANQSRPPDPPTRSDQPTANQIRPPDQTSKPDYHP